MPPCTWIAARAFSTPPRPRAASRRRWRATGSPMPGIVEHGGRRVGGAAGEGGPDVHVGEQVLHGLERSDRDAELLALERVAARRLERGVGRRRAAWPRVRTVPTRRSVDGVARVADARAARQRVGAPDGRERIERRERLERGQVRPRADEHAVGAQHEQRVDLGGVLDDDRIARRAGLLDAADETLAARRRRRRTSAASVVHRTGPPTRCAPSCSKTIAPSTTPRPSPPSALGDEQAEDAELGQLAPRAPVDALAVALARSAPARTAPRRTGGRCPGARAALRRGGSPCSAAASSLGWKISRCYL